MLNFTETSESLRLFQAFFTKLFCLVSVSYSVTAVNWTDSWAVYTRVRSHKATPVLPYNLLKLHIRVDCCEVRDSLRLYFQSCSYNFFSDTSNVHSKLPQLFDCYIDHLLLTSHLVFNFLLLLHLLVIFWLHLPTLFLL